MKNDRFRRGQSVFTCDCCGRQTRNTGQPTQSTTCLECWELAGLQNMIFDGEEIEEIASERDRYMHTIIARGGNEERVRSEFPDLWDAPEDQPSKP